MNMQSLNIDTADGEALVRRAGMADAEAWNAFVGSRGDSTFFHRFEWGGIIERTYGHEPVYLLASSAAGDITGVLPLIHVRSPLFGKALISTAFTVGGGVLAADVVSAQALSAMAARLGADLGVDYVELRGGEAPADWLRKSETYAGFIAPLDPDPEEALKAIPRKKRADVRKAIKAAEAGELGVDRSGDIDTFYALYAESVRNLGTPVLAKKLIREQLAAFGPSADIAIVRAGGRPVAGLVSFRHGEVMMPYYGGASPDARRLHAYEYLYWAQMRHAVEAGCTQFDFGRSKTGTGAYDYKRHWGFEPQPLTYHYHLVRASEMPDVNPNNPKFRLLTKLWQRLPLPVANRLGPLVASQLG